MISLIFLIVVNCIGYAPKIVFGHTISESDSVRAHSGLFHSLVRLPSFTDDVMFTAGMNTSGLYYSQVHRELKYHSGFQVGAEGYLPMARIMFLQGGLHIAQRNFMHRPDQRVVFRNVYLDVPVMACFELPELRTFDLRLCIGFQGSLRLHSPPGSGNMEIYQQSEGITFQSDRFRRMDAGWTFGLSSEYRNVYLRVRSYAGFFNLDTRDQGMMHTIYVDVGYFIFRSLRK
jgi:hypothetical protein